MSLSELERVCKSRGLRLTEHRRELFKALRAAGKPISAYDLIPRMERRLSKRVAPLTIYRALDFLVEHGLAHKIASNHTYALCDHPHTEHESVHLICTQCGGGEELALGELSRALDSAAAARQFVPKRHIVELEGRCGKCAE